MRRTMIALAIVLGVAVVDVTAQEHAAKPEAHGAKPEAATKPEAAKKAEPATKPEPAKKPEAAAPTAEPPAGNFARSGPDLIALAERIHKRIAEVRSESKAAEAAGRSVKSGESSGESSAASRQSRVQLEWRVPMITWPEELLEPEALSTH